MPIWKILGAFSKW